MFALIFFALFAYPLVYVIIGHPLQLSETPDAPFPLQAFKNYNFWLALLALTVAGVVPEIIVSAYQRRFRTTFQNLCQEVESLPWFRKQQELASLGKANFPVHKRLDELDEKLWKDETKGVGTSSGSDNHTGKDFSMDDYTSMATGNRFRVKIRKNAMPVPGLT